MSKLWRGLLLLLVLLFSVLSASAHDSNDSPQSKSGVSIPAQTEETGSASLRIIPDEAVVGRTHFISITNLNRGEEIVVRIFYDGEEIYKTEQSADNRGRVEVEIFTEADDSPGEYIVDVRNVLGRVLAQSSFTVLEAEGLDATINVVPVEAEVGTVFTLNISEAQAFVGLQALFRDADGMIVYSTTVYADTDGLASVEFPTEELAAGIYNVSLVLRNDPNVEVASSQIRVLEKLFPVTTTIEPPEIRPSPSPESEETPESETVPETTEVAQTDETISTDTEDVFISLKPDRALRGERIEIFVEKLEAGETVRLEMRYGTETVYHVERQATEAGVIGLAVGIEDSDPSGVYEFLVLRDAEIIARARLTIVQDASELPLPAAKLSVSPESGAMGTDHVIEVRGLNAEEAIELKLEYEGEIVLSLERAANAEGTAVIVLSTNLDDRPGDYNIQVLREDGTELSGSLRIEDAILMGDAEISIQPQRGVLETDHHIKVSGLFPNETVTLNIGFADETVYTTERTADKNGTFSIDITSQEGDAIGEYEVVVLRENGDESRASLFVESSGTFELSVQPETVAIGDSFDVLVQGLHAAETVALSISAEGNIIFETDGQANEDGNLVFELFSEESDTPGIVRVVATRENGETASAEFELFARRAAIIDISVSPDTAPSGSVF